MQEASSIRKIMYRDGFKYQLTQGLVVPLENFPVDLAKWAEGAVSIWGGLVQIYYTGPTPILRLRQGYCWDGPTCALDTKNFMRGSAVHDALLYLMGKGKIPAIPCKAYADDLLIQLCAEDGMGWLRRKWVKAAIHMLGNPDGSTPKKVQIAP